MPDGAIVDVPGMVEDVNRTYKIGNDDFYAASAIELSETMGFACAHEVYADKLTYKRELKENWQGLCAPFRLDKADWEQFGPLYRLDNVVEDENGKLSLSIVEVEEFEPNTPYLIKVLNPGTMEVDKEGCALCPSTGLQPTVAETDNVRCELSCVYDFTDVQYSDGENGRPKTYALAGGSFKRPNPEKGATVKPYRVMLTVASKGSTPPARIEVVTDGGTTVIEAIETESETQQWYDLNGRPATRGLLISSAGKVLKR